MTDRSSFYGRVGKKRTEFFGGVLHSRRGQEAHSLGDCLAGVRVRMKGSEGAVSKDKQAGSLCVHTGSAQMFVITTHAEHE